MRRCVVVTFIIPNTFIKMMAQNMLRRIVVTFAMANTSIGIPVQYLRRYVPLQVLFANKLCAMVLRFYLHHYLTHE